jgi:hydrogenase/urease accessory protein HupE
VTRVAAMALALLLTAAAAASAHEVRPGFLELRETDPGSYGFLWKKPTGGEIEIFIAPVVPAGCRFTPAAQQQLTPGALVVRGTLRCDGGIEGKTLAIDGLEATVTDVIVRVLHRDGRLESYLLKPMQPTVTLGASTTAWQRARGYVRLGTEHILLGGDHLLFVLGLLLLVSSRMMLLKTITAFTVAHSLTLAGATLGFVHVPGPPAEAAIALSIVFVAAEIVHGRQGMPGLTEKFPWIVAFTFGLLHGFGFAGALNEVGLPQSAIPVALFFFNVGVEGGQLLFIASLIGVMAVWRRIAGRVHAAPGAWAWRVPPYAIGSVASFWFIQRIAAF